MPLARIANYTTGKGLTRRHCGSFAACHSEGEKRPKNLAQDGLREAMSHCFQRLLVVVLSPLAGES
jgi:hypothetical protein